MDSSPHVVPITDFRRLTARIIGDAAAAGAPVFITQGGYVTAAVLSRGRYDDLVHRSALLEAAQAKDTSGATLDRAAIEDAEAELVRIEWMRRAGRAETRFGLTDVETAAFLEAEGFGLEPG